jgi:hypothetical protein
MSSKIPTNSVTYSGLNNPSTHLGLKSVTHGAKNLEALDKRIDELVGSAQEPVLIDIADSVELLKLAYENLEFDDSADDERKAHIAALEYLLRTSKKPRLKGKMWLMVEKDRGMHWYREEGRFSNAPDTKQQGLARSKAEDLRTLMLLRQNAEESMAGVAFLSGGLLS